MGDGQNSRQKTLEQRRAADAWSKVTGVSDSLQSGYASQAQRLGSLIQVNGLGQTLAFLRSKAGDKQEMQVLYEHISTWVTPHMGVQGDLLEQMMGWSSADYRRATTEALAYALWLRRFVEAQGWTAEGDDNP